MHRALHQRHQNDTVRRHVSSDVSYRMPLSPPIVNSVMIRSLSQPTSSHASSLKTNEISSQPLRPITIQSFLETGQQRCNSAIRRLPPAWNSFVHRSFISRITAIITETSLSSDIPRCYTNESVITTMSVALLAAASATTREERHMAHLMEQHT